MFALHSIEQLIALYYISSNILVIVVLDFNRPRLENKHIIDYILINGLNLRNDICCRSGTAEWVGIWTFVP